MSNVVTIKLTHSEKSTKPDDKSNITLEANFGESFDPDNPLPHQAAAMVMMNALLEYIDNGDTFADE